MRLWAYCLRCGDSAPDKVKLYSFWQNVYLLPSRNGYRGKCALCKEQRDLVGIQDNFLLCSPCSEALEQSLLDDDPIVCATCKRPRKIRVNAVSPGPTHGNFGDGVFDKNPEFIKPLAGQSVFGRIW
jgi:hypothetical protein